MAKILCKCGNTIFDQTDFIENKAYFIKDKEYINYEQKRINLINDFVKAIILNKRKEWVEKEFGTGCDFDNHRVISYLISKDFLEYELPMFQCDECGRVLIENKDNKFCFFVPEDGDCKDIFDVEES